MAKFQYDRAIFNVDLFQRVIYGGTFYLKPAWLNKPFLSHSRLLI